MINITVKTLDSQTRQFELPNSISIKEFKERIASSVNLPANQQRLIFQGKVLKDDFNITPEHDGKVLHLVKPLPGSRATSAASTPASHTSTQSSSAGSATGNPAQLSQMVFQQAMAGLDSLLGGGRVNVQPGSSSSGSNTFTDQARNIHVSVNTTSSMTGSNGSSFRPPGAQQTNQSHPSGPNVFVPRQSFANVERAFEVLEEVLSRLENGAVTASSADEVSSSSTGQDAASTNTSANSAGATASNETENAANSSNPAETARSCPNHPTPGEFASLYKRMLTAQHRLEPFLNRSIEFFNTDPSFQSTQSEAYTSTARLLQLTLECMDRLGEIQRVLSSIVIPLAQTPPRVLSLRNQPGGPQFTNQNQFGPPRFAGPQVPPPNYHATQPQGFRFQVPFVGGAAARTTVPLNQGVQMRIRVPGPANAPVRSAPPRAGQSHAGNQQQTAPPSGTNGFASNYSVVIDTVIQPRIEIAVGTEMNDPAHAPQPVPTGSQQRAPINQNTPQNPPNVPLNFPVIPGVPPEMIQNAFQSMTRAFLQQQQQRQHGGGNQQASGRIVVNGPPGGPNQVSMDIASIISQAVTNALSSAGSQPPTSTSSVNTQSRTTHSSTTVSSTTASSTTTVPPNRRPTSRAPPRSGAPTLLTGGSFGRRAPTNRAPPGNGGGSAPTLQIMNNPIIAMFLNQPISQFINSLGFDMSSLDTETGFIGRLSRAVSAEMSFAELMNFSQGQPVQLNGLRRNLRHQILEECFNGCTPTRELAEEYACKASEDCRDYVTEMLTGIATVDDVDLIESNILLLKHGIAKTVNIILFTDQSQFCHELYQHLRYMLSLVVAVNTQLLPGGRRELGNRLEHYVANMPYGSTLTAFARMRPSNQASRGQSHPIEAYVQSLEELHSPFTQDEIDQFIVRSTPVPREETPSLEVEAEFSDDEVDSSEKLETAAASSLDSSKQSGDNLGTATDSTSWKEEVPQDWVQTIVDDIATQREIAPRVPFSDAYLAGMPSSKKNTKHKSSQV